MTEIPRFEIPGRRGRLEMVLRFYNVYFRPFMPQAFLKTSSSPAENFGGGRTVYMVTVDTSSI